MRIFIVIIIIAFQSNLFSQNLLPNGSFESTGDFNYIDPVSAFPNLDYWYEANYYLVDTIYPGTPDLFDSNHPWPPSDPINFWNAAKGASEGDFHAGIANHLLFEGYLMPEAVASSLTEPLEAGVYYHIELSVRNKGVDAYLDHEPILCVPVEYKQIAVLLDPDSIYVTIDDDAKDSYYEASTAMQLRSDRMESDLVGSWDKIGTCFQAEGGEQFLAVTTSSGRFEVNPPCVIHDDHWAAFYIYYFDIDDIKLTKLTEEYTVKQTICTGRETKFNIDQLLDLPIVQNEIEFHWEDGQIDSLNYFSEAGTYHVDAILDCKTIPITLELENVKCDPDIFVPNIFSPNGDGYNDYLETFISVELPIEDFRFSVFNRWGAEVFSTNDIYSNWDGTFNGKPLDNGVYLWTISYVINDIELGKTRYQEQGDVTIIR